LWYNVCIYVNSLCMLRVKSFKIEDSEGINKLLDTNRLAPGAHILLSGGELCIPYEDGEPETNTQKIVAIKEQKNVIIKEMDIIRHSQKVLSLLINESKARINQYEADLEEAKSKKVNKGDITAKLTAERNSLTQLENQQLQNNAEQTRLTLNLEMFDEQIEELND